MIFIEQDARLLLMERLDECLKVHADMLDAENIGSIYELQGLSELHYYLKAEHEFTPAEVEALLEFQDPLDVARWCWEENTHEHSFPICEVLGRINAHERFQKQPEISALDKKYMDLMKLLGQKLYEYKENLCTWDSARLIEQIELIGAAFAAYSFMSDSYQPRMEEIDFLLGVENPLRIIQNCWGYDAVSAGEGMIKTMMEDFYTSPEQGAASKSLKERLHNAVREVKEHPKAEKPSHDTGAR